MKGEKKKNRVGKKRRAATYLPVHTCEKQAEKMWGQKMSELVTHTHRAGRERGGDDAPIMLGEDHIMND